MMSFNISYGEVLNSVWIVVEAINNTVEFQISYPESLDQFSNPERDLPRKQLYNVIVNGHWERPTANIRREE